MTTTEIFQKHFGDICAVGIEHPKINQFFQELNDTILLEDEAALKAYLKITRKEYKRANKLPDSHESRKIQENAFSGYFHLMGLRLKQLKAKTEAARELNIKLEKEAQNG